MRGSLLCVFNARSVALISPRRLNALAAAGGALGAVSGYHPIAGAIRDYDERIRQAESFGDTGLRVDLENQIADETRHKEESSASSLAGLPDRTNVRFSSSNVGADGNPSAELPLKAPAVPIRHFWPSRQWCKCE